MAGFVAAIAAGIKRRLRMIWSFPCLQKTGAASQGLAVQETTESARRWSGFVCPDCRFVFRVPRDHDGLGIVCPSCRRMLKIPQPGDKTPPLVLSLRKVPEAETVEVLKDGRRRKKKKNHQQEAHAWDSGSSGRQRVSGRRERRQTLWMLVGGTMLLIFTIAGVIYALRQRPKDALTMPATPDVKTSTSSADDTKKPEPRLSDDEILTLAEPLAKKFLNATSVDEILPIIRHREVSEERIRKAHPDGKITAPGLSAYNTDMLPVRQGKAFSVRVRTGDFSDKSLCFVETPDGIKIDWESWVAWSEMSWEDFLATKPTTPRMFRLVLSPVEYFNFDFRDDIKWQSYYLASVDGKQTVYGYAERGSELNAKLRPPPEMREIAMTLTLRFSQHPSSGNQVIIDKFITDGWVIENEDTP